MKNSQDNYQHRRHSKNLLMVHLIFVTRYRKALLFGELREDIKHWMFETCQTHHWYIKRMETDRDHIHILLQYNPTDRISTIVTVLKQCTTHYAWEKYEYLLRKNYWKERTFWSDGYFVASVGQVSQETIEHYIENQG